MTQPCLPPLGNFSPLSFEMPRGACDSHAHVFGPFDSFPLADDRSYTPQEYPAPAFVAHLDRFNLDRGVLVTGSANGTDNRTLLGALNAYPDQLRGVVVPSNTTTPAELAAWHDAGVRGVRINLFKRDGQAVYRNGVGLEVLEALAPIIAGFGWHAQIWIHAPDLPELAPRLLRLGLPLVIDHMGRMATSRGVNDSGFQFLCRMLSEGTAWVKLSGADRNGATGQPYTDVSPFALALIKANIDRVIWGSDWPHINYFKAEDIPDDGALVNLLAQWLPNETQRHRVLVDNPEKLYDFPVMRVPYGQG